jgi:lipoate-protein ligase A
MRRSDGLETSSAALICLSVQTPPAGGTWNMAVDEALAEYAAEQRVAALRFYEWAEPTLSLGYFQAAADRLKHPASLRRTLVRRPSGGGAILHDFELTYCLAIPAGHPAAIDAQRLYLAIHDALAAALSALGVSAAVRRCSDCEQPTQAARLESEAFLCFQRRAAGDLLLNSVKVAGSAQRRRRGVVMQHGSVLLATSPFAPELPGIADLTGRTIGANSLAGLFQTALGDRLNMKYENAAGFEPIEKRAKELERIKFASADWTFRR